MRAAAPPVHAVVRCACARDLLPSGDAVVLPHARLRRNHTGWCGGVRSNTHQRPLVDAGAFERRRAPATIGNVAALPAVQGGRNRPHGAVHLAGAMRLRALTWVTACALVVLAARTL